MIIMIYTHFRAFFKITTYLVIIENIFRIEMNRGRGGGGWEFFFYLSSTTGNDNNIY